MRDDLRRLLAAYVPQAQRPDPLPPPAGVLVLLHERPGGPHVIFQKRTESVRDHKGQISFPGGAMDPGDPHVLHTALRETHEEIGVDPGHVDVLGQLDDMVTVSNFLVTPYVGWLDRYPYEWHVSSHEVAYLLEVPLEHLLNPRNLIPDRRVINGREYTFQSYRFGDDLIWGATARMLGNFLDLMQAM
ncbi:MAG: CoA pyrophosphatase [Chloroflexi bacterium]|nr:CoA pyrophosphatase [Chloroflexota bacterium]PWB42757.1 MAG: CoA pyrophosphatase [Dehalococcoidia bacterium]